MAQQDWAPQVKKNTQGVAREHKGTPFVRCKTAALLTLLATVLEQGDGSLGFYLASSGPSPLRWYPS